MEKMLEVYNLEKLPITPEGMKYFACIGGEKNYQCFLETKKLSRADFMEQYAEQLDPCHIPIYEDRDIIIRQDAQIPIPGFYIVATKDSFRKISFMDSELYKKCMYYSVLIKRKLFLEFGIEKVYMYYDEHYQKPSSTHFCVMPIYDKIVNDNNLSPTILKYDIWKYQELFQFKDSKDDIYQINDGMRKVLKK